MGIPSLNLASASAGPSAANRYSSKLGLSAPFWGMTLESLDPPCASAFDGSGGGGGTEGGPWPGVTVMGKTAKESANKTT